MTGARPAAWCLVLTGLFALGWASTPGPTPLAPSAASPRGFGPSPETRSPRDSLTRLVVSRDLFRPGRRPSATAYDPQRAANPTPVAPAPPKPTLRLLGLIEGADATAIVEGFPGIEGSRVARSGDAVGGLTVQRIAAGEVRIVGMDTVWVLRVRGP